MQVSASSFEVKRVAFVRWKALLVETVMVRQFVCLSRC